MATRKTNETPAVIVDEINVIELYARIVEFAPTDDTAVTVAELNDEMGGNTFAGLNILADAELIIFDPANGGKIANAIPDVSEESAKETAYSTLMDTSFSVAEAPKPKRTRRTKAQMEADKQDAAPAVEPVKDSEGENITIPVDFDDPSKGRRELDASKGERVIGEDTYTVSEMRREDIALAREIKETLPAMHALHAPKTDVAIKELADKLAELTLETWTPTYADPKNEPYEGPESIPAVPAGVTENTWFMAHYADTESARAWWMSKADAQVNAHNLNQPETAPF